MANSLTTISANNLKMTDNIKACGAPRPLDTARRPKPPPGGERRRERSQARRGANATARRYVEEKIGGVVEKYAGVSQRCDTHLSVMRNPAVADSDVAEVVVFCKGEVVRAEERSPSMYSSIDLVADKVARKLRKVKERREGKRNKPQLKMSLGEMLEDPVEMEPEVFDATSLIRRKTHAMPAQSLSDAMICMDGLDHDFYMFTNEETGKINVMYKRKEGGLGLIEPENWRPRRRGASGRASSLKASQRPSARTAPQRRGRRGGAPSGAATQEARGALRPRFLTFFIYRLYRQGDEGEHVHVVVPPGGDDREHAVLQHRCK